MSGTVKTGVRTEGCPISYRRPADSEYSVIFWRKQQVHDRQERRGAGARRLEATIQNTVDIILYMHGKF